MSENIKHQHDKAVLLVGFFPKHSLTTLCPIAAFLSIKVFCLD